MLQENLLHPYSPAEELVNGLTHGLGVLLSIAGLAVLLAGGTYRGDIWSIASFSIFGGSLIILYSASTLYHSSSRPSWKRGLKKVDHSAIFLLIAGTYTPFLLIHLRGPLGWSLFGVIWSLAITGVTIKLFYFHRIRKLSVGIYLFMGWLCVIAMRELAHSLPAASFSLLLIGGALYTTGVVFYSWKKLPYHHAVWHVFVLGGSISHFFSVLKSVS